MSLGTILLIILAIVLLGGFSGFGGGPFYGTGYVEAKVALRRPLKRRYVLAFLQKLPQCLVGIEARCEAAQERCR